MKKSVKEEFVEPLIHMTLALIVAIAVGLLLWKAPHEEGFAIAGHKPVRATTQQAVEAAEPLVATPDEKVSSSEKPAKNALEEEVTEQTETVSENTSSDEQVEVVLEDTLDEQAETVSEDISTEQTETVSEESSSTISEDTSGEQAEITSSDNNQHEEIMDIGDPPGPIEPEMVMDIGDPPGPIEPEMVMDIGDPAPPFVPDIGPAIMIDEDGNIITSAPTIGPAIWIDDDGNVITASSEGEIIVTKPIVEETVDEKK